VEVLQKREIVNTLLNKGILIDGNILKRIDMIKDYDNFHTYLIQKIGDFNSDDVTQIFDRYKQEDNIRAEYTETNISETTRKNIEVVFSYESEPKKRVVQDFVNYFTTRYNSIKPFLQQRKELQNLTSINRLEQKRERGPAAIIGLVTEKQITKTDKVILKIEDTTGSIKAIVSPNCESYNLAKETVLDEVVGVVGNAAGEVIFTSKIIYPDVPIYNELKKSPDETYALFVADFHIGSNVFLKEPVKKLISWIRGEIGGEAQKEIVKKLKYIFIAGDIVEGVGIYPNQENELDIKDIYGQYEEFAKYMRMIPENIDIIICPGNHDAMRIAEPQPTIYKDFAESLWSLPNVTMVSNPSYVNIHKSEGFPGFDVLMYHGFSFTYYADCVESIRSKGGQDRVDLIMKFLMQRRHLAPTHKSTLYLPDTDKDSLVIDKIPDFFVTGHIHRVAASNYRNITMLSCSCWLEKTEFQEKLGLHPQPGRAILVNLQTRKVKILKFYDDKDE